jgi:hypothetical protein
VAGTVTIDRRAMLRMLGGGGALSGAYYGKQAFDHWELFASENVRLEKYPIVALPLRLQSSYRGKIRRVFVGGPKSCHAEMELLCRTLTKHVAPATDLGSRGAGLVDANFLFLRDVFMFTRDGTLLVSPVSGYANRAMLRSADRLAQYLGRELPVRSAPFRFVGGEVLQVNDRTWMPKTYDQAFRFLLNDASSEDPQVAAFGFREPIYDIATSNTWLSKMTDARGKPFFGPTETKIERPHRLYRGMGLEPDFPSALGSVMGHIDLIATPVGTGRTLVADNEAGLRILRSADHRDLRGFLDVCREHLRQNSGAKTSEEFERTFWHILQHGVAPSPASYVTDAFTQATRDAEELCQYWGSEAIRIPSFIAMLPNTLKFGFCLSYNNALVQAAPQGNVAVVPTFGIRALDEAALAVYRREGYQTLSVPMPCTAVHGAGAHCVTLEQRA